MVLGPWCSVLCAGIVAYCTRVHGDKKAPVVLGESLRDRVTHEQSLRRLVSALRVSTDFLINEQGH